MNPKIGTLLLLLLGLILPALSGKCLDEDRLPITCGCEDSIVDEDVDIELSCSGSLEELKKALRLMDKNSRLEVQLDEMNLGYLPARIFDGLNVVKLDISHCVVNGLGPEGERVLQGLEDKLEVLVIASCIIHEGGQTEASSLDHLRSLKEIDLSYTSINELPDSWFSSPPPALEHLTLSNNGITKLGERAFEKLVNLKLLELHGNRFGPLKRSMLPGEGNRLKHLELDNNALTSLPDDIFSEFPELKVLSIRTNGITHLQERVFKPIWSQLDVFDGRGNPFECDSAMEWLIRVKTEAALILGKCQGPLGREGLDLDDLIENRGN